MPDLDFSCECDEADRHSRITMTIDEFEAINQTQNRFIVCHGYEDLDVEDVVGEHDRRHLIVAMRGLAAEFVKERGRARDARTKRCGKSVASEHEPACLPLKSGH